MLLRFVPKSSHNDDECHVAGALENLLYDVCAKIDSTQTRNWCDEEVYLHAATIYDVLSGKITPIQDCYYEPFCAN